MYLACGSHDTQIDIWWITCFRVSQNAFGLLEDSRLIGGTSVILAAAGLYISDAAERDCVTLVIKVESR